LNVLVARFKFFQLGFALIFELLPLCIGRFVLADEAIQLIQGPGLQISVKKLVWPSCVISFITGNSPRSPRLPTISSVVVELLQMR
jgi:hypothetical protein